MDSDGASSALGIAQRAYDAGDTEKALRFVKKSIALSPSPNASFLLKKIESGVPSSNARASTSASSSATAPPATNAQTRPAANKAAPEQDKREFTPDQVALVKKVKACRVNDYYAILAIEKGCDDGAVKKAYRKLALRLHPDKCGAPGTEEAFKMVSKAFQVLSDSNKRAIFDQTGSDPDSRGGGGGGGGFPSAFARGGGRGMGGQSAYGNQFGGDEISPEDLFRMFFGGGGQSFGGGFGGGGFQFYGPGGVRMGGTGPQRTQAGGARTDRTESTSMWIQILPLAALFLFSILTQLPSLFGLSGPADPEFDFAPSARYSVPQHTHTKHQVPYFVVPHQFAAHPIYHDALKANPHLGFESKHAPGTAAHKKDSHAFLRAQTPLAIPITTEEESKPKPFVVPKGLAEFERKVEKSYMNVLHTYCRQQIENRNHALGNARGVFGIGADWNKVEELTKMKLEHCEELSRMGYHVRY